MLFIVLFALFVLIADQLSKIYFASYHATTAISDIPLIQNILHIVYTKNTGAAFSIFPNGRWFFVAATIIFCIIFVIWLIRLPKLHLLLKLAASLILAGAVGNLIDRIFLSYVRDFIDFRFLNGFAIFNIADSAVVVGTTLFCIYLLFTHEKFLGINNAKQTS